MARKLREGFPAAVAGTAIAEPVQETGKKWLAFTSTDELPQAKTVEKTRVRELRDGTTYSFKESKVVKAGESRYSVNDRGELIAHYRKRGGVGRKLVYQFKRSFPETQEGMARKQKDAAFRRFLRERGIPGA